MPQNYVSKIDCVCIWPYLLSFSMGGPYFVWALLRFTAFAEEKSLQPKIGTQCEFFSHPNGASKTLLLHFWIK